MFLYRHKDRLTEVQRRQERTKARLDGEHDALLTLEERAEELARMQADEETSSNAVTAEVARLKDETFKHSQELFALRGRERGVGGRTMLWIQLRASGKTAGRTSGRSSK